MKSGSKDKSFPRTINNLEIYAKEKYVIASVNPKIYPLDVVQSALYVMMDRVYGVVDGDPAEEILVELRPKEKKQDLLVLGREFNEELVNYAVYKVQSERNKALRDLLVKKALGANVEDTTASESSTPLVSETETNTKIALPQDLSIPPVEDPLGIARPWSEDNAKKLKKTHSRKKK